MLNSELVNAAAEMFHIHPRDLIGPYRFKFLMSGRFALAKALRMRGWTLSEIGRLMNRDHTSIMYQVKEAEYWMSRDQAYADKVKALAELKIEREWVWAPEKAA